MRWRLLAGVGVVGAIATAGACALDIPDVIVDGGLDAASDSPPGDVNAPDVPVPQCDASCAPTGFTPALFALDRSTACPANMQTLDLAADPDAAPSSACVCDCSITSPPSCLPSTVSHEIQITASDGGAPSCTVGGNALTFDGGCFSDPGFTIHLSWKGDPYLPVSPGTCTSTATANANVVPSTASRLCVDTTCTGTCASQGNLKACVYAQGNVACPSGFSQVHHAGTVAVACSACSACTMTTSGTCQGTIGIYFDTACTTKIIDVSMDGGCAFTNADGQTGGSLKYTPVVVGAGCNAGTSKNPSVSLTGEITVCCP